MRTSLIKRATIIRLLCGLVFAGVMMAGPMADSAQANAKYQRFVKSFWSVAKRAGISRATYDAAFKGMTPDPEVIKKNARQPEFLLPPSHYLALTVTDTRIKVGAEMLEKYKSELEAIQKKYGVDKQVLLAIWGMETNFGQFMGGHNVIRALSTLAYSGRRQKFGRSELLAALKMLERGYVTPDKIGGSWAGALGYTQLLPSNYLKFAVDFDGDGKRDIWETPADALASTANYLARNGWKRGPTWGYEVVLPKRVSSRLAGRRNSRSISRWKSLGVKRVRGQKFSRGGDRAYLFLPAGKAGPALLLMDNFRVIMRYNASHKYALSVAHLSDRILGVPAFERSWPDGVRALDEAERFELQKRLTLRGYEIGKIDGVLGSKTRGAIGKLQKEKKMKVDGFPKPKILEILREEQGPLPEPKAEAATPAEAPAPEPAQPAPADAPPPATPAPPAPAASPQKPAAQ